jgi:hypothetical protein
MMGLAAELMDSISHRSQGLVERVMRVIQHGETVTFGVICNRLRTTPQKDVALALEALVDNGRICLRLDKHPKNHTSVYTFYVGNDATNRAKALGEERKDD